jgi:hypothetical protein
MIPRLLLRVMLPPVLEVPQDSFNPSPGEEQLFKNQIISNLVILLLAFSKFNYTILKLLTLCWNVRQGRDPVHNHSR